jgi:hypothetical protein
VLLAVNELNPHLHTDFIIFKNTGRLARKSKVCQTGTMNKVRVDGSLDYDEDSSSESEPDVPQRPPSPPMVLQSGGAGDDEEIEYFGDKKAAKAAQVQRSSEAVQVNPAPCTANEGDSRLASILSKTVETFESGDTAPFGEQEWKPAAADVVPAG